MRPVPERYLPRLLRERWRSARERFTSYAQRSYSQEGEDMILRRIFETKTTGFYVDVGAHHPIRFSNTYYFYRRGWRGINIEPNPRAMPAFQRVRARDVHILSGISERGGARDYYMFDEPALNTFDMTKADEYRRAGYRLVETRTIETSRLDHVLDAGLPPDTRIDFLSIDVEGLDLEVLRSNNWHKYRPSWVLIEDHETRVDRLLDGETHGFMTEQGYTIEAKTFYTVFYRESHPGSTTDGCPSKKGG
ncbi:MAG: FkbM family methyltransferase [Acidiferrobacteraceae bacterium]